MTPTEQAREWAEKEAKAVMNNPSMISLTTMFERAYLAGYAARGEWISVDQRLPDNCRLTEVCYMDGKIQRHAFARYYKFHEEEFTPEDWNDYENARFLDHDTENGVSWLKPGFYMEYEAESGEWITMPITATHWKELTPLPSPPNQ